MSATTSDTNNKLRWSSFGITDTGKVRKHNEDSMLERSAAGLWVVADGMGGHAKGDVASQMIVSTLQQVKEGTRLSHFIDAIEDSITEVNKKLLQQAKEAKKRTTIGSTIVSMIAYKKYCIYLWAGDSRLYRLRNKQIRQITTDHSQVEVYIEQGLITREEAATHPHGNMITRAVGATDDLYLDIGIQEIHKSDRYLLCSDGLTKHILDLEIEAFMKEGNAETCCRQLIDTTLERGAGDNVTAIIVDIK